MPLPALIPLLGSIAGTLAGPGLGAGVASALGLGGTAAGSLIAAAAPKAIGAGIASLAAGASAPDAVQQVMQAQPGVGGSQRMPTAAGGIFTAPPPTSAPAMYAPPTPIQSLPQQQAILPQELMPQGVSPQGPMGGGMPTPTQILAPQPQVPGAMGSAPQPASLNTGLGSLRGRSGPAMPPMMKGFV